MSELELSLYPVDLSLLLAHVTYADPTMEEHPTRVAQEALICWNAYLQGGSEAQQAAFLHRTHWLLAHEIRLANDAGGWPILCPLPEYHKPQVCLSALTQGGLLSVFARAYQMTGDETFLRAAQRTVRPFERDILEGGVSSSLHENALFFEEIAVYPAAHTLSGYILALFGLYDYVAVTGEQRIVELIQHSLSTFHTLLPLFDTGYWTHDDLLSRRLASHSSHSLHVALLAALARYSACEECAALARRWESYQHHPGYRLRLSLARGTAAFQDGIRAGLRPLLGRPSANEGRDAPAQVCVPIPQFPVPGGMRGVLAGIAQAMNDRWQIVYLTNYRGQEDAATKLDIQTFGRRKTHPWQFPGVWLYSLAGFGKLCAFLRQNTTCHLILPQDGVFTGAFAALVGKVAGRRVVCMDHGNVTWLDNPALRMERMKTVRTYPWLKRLLAYPRFALYWASLPLLARLATRFTDLFLVAGDEVEDVYQQRLGVHPSRIMRYEYIVDTSRFPRLDDTTRARLRAEQALPTAAILITMINRLATEKGIDIALMGIAQALPALPPEIRARVRILIAGDGPLRAQVQADIHGYGLEEVCLLWGEAKPSEVITLLGISDIFLYNGTRGTNYSLAVLEAMTAGCAVIASTAPHSNARLLADGRGIAIAPGDADAVAAALICLCGDPEQGRRMGNLAREYVATHHTVDMLRRTLWRATFFVPTLEVEDEDLPENPRAPISFTSAGTAKDSR